MNDDDKGMDELLEIIDNIQLIPEENLDNMDLYELCYYMQNLNLIDTLDGDDVKEGEL